MEVPMSFKKRLSLSLKKNICAVVLYFLFGALKQLASCDTRIAKEIAAWPEGMVYCLKASKNGPFLCFEKSGDTLNRLKEYTPDSPNVRITFKSIDSAFLVLTGQLGLAGSYSAHGFILEGDVQKTMSLCRCADLAEGYLFPHVMTRRILKEVPEKEHFSLNIYGRILLGMFNRQYRQTYAAPQQYMSRKA